MKNLIVTLAAATLAGAALAQSPYSYHPLESPTRIYSPYSMIRYEATPSPRPVPTYKAPTPSYHSEPRYLPESAPTFVSPRRQR